MGNEPFARVEGDFVCIGPDVKWKVRGKSLPYIIKESINKAHLAAVREVERKILEEVLGLAKTYQAPEEFLEEIRSKAEEAPNERAG